MINKCIRDGKWFTKIRKCKKLAKIVDNLVPYSLDWKCDKRLFSRIKIFWRGKG
jgi:hypothetical protein